MKIIALVVAIGAAIQTPDDSAAVIARLDAYMAAYEPRLSELVADERMEQLVEVGGSGRRQRRILNSEVAFISLQNSGWLGFRHVKSVNNRGVSRNTRSLDATLRMPDMEAAKALLRDSAAHNLGLARTTNLPNLPLEFLHIRNRERLVARADGRVMVQGVETTRIVFEEHGTPTLIGNPRTGDDMPAEVRAWIDDTGRLRRAEVITYTSARKSPYEHLVRVEFKESSTFGLLLPVEMYEEFPVPWPSSGRANATYSNFRRFQTSARIVPQ